MYTLKEKYDLIKREVVKYPDINPITILNRIMGMNFINIHGPEHHYLDGAAFLAAYKNAGGELDLENALDELSKRSIEMPGAMCGLWGVCGSTASLGASLAIINNTNPLSNNDYYKDNMEYTSKVINIMSKIGGPRCCKRNAYISIINAVKFVKEKYGIEMEYENISCNFTNYNQQCIKSKCPFHKGNH